MINRTIASVALAAVLAIGSHQAFASDLGGSCCADLEERIAELEATTARKGNRKMSLHVYGQVNEAILFHDIDAAPRARMSVINNANSTSRFGMRGDAKINEDWSAGYLMEIAVGGFDLGTGAETGALSVRHSALYIKSKSLGTIWLGHTGMATDSIVEIDLSNSAAASTPLSLAPVDSALIGVSIVPFDGERNDVVKYVSPSVGGFSLSAAWADEDTYDVALRYAGELGGLRVAAGVGYREDNGPFGLVPDTRSYLGSASVMHTPSGVFVSGSAGWLDLEGIGNLDGYAVRGGIEKKTTSLGKTTLYAEWGEPRLYGAGIVQAIDPAAMELYGSWRRIDPDTVGLDQSDVVIVGARIKF